MNVNTAQQEWVIEPPVYHYLRREDLEKLLLDTFGETITVFVRNM